MAHCIIDLPSLVLCWLNVRKSDDCLPTPLTRVIIWILNLTTGIRPRRYLATTRERARELRIIEANPQGHMSILAVIPVFKNPLQHSTNGCIIPGILKLSSIQNLFQSTVKMIKYIAVIQIFNFIFLSYIATKLVLSFRVVLTFSIGKRTLVFPLENLRLGSKTWKGFDQVRQPKDKVETNETSYRIPLGIPRYLPAW